MHILMFHDVINVQHQVSGFQKVGAVQYCIHEDKFVQLIEEAVKDDNEAVLSFDDGGSSFYHVIAPILERYGKKGLFFISTKYIDTPGFLTVEEIRELDVRGHIIASHSHSHPKIISELPADKIRQEWVVSKNILEEIIGHEVKIASIPGGAVSNDVLSIMCESGYQDIYTSEPTCIERKKGNSTIYGRYAITETSSPEYLKKVLMDKSFRNYLLMRYKLLRIGKKILGRRYNTFKQIFLGITRK